MDKMDKGVFVFTFSPIQPFISQARKTADLWVGSQILSQLASAVINCISRENGEIVFPYIDINNPPNKIVAIIDWDTTIQNNSIPKKVIEAFNYQWDEFKKQAICHFTPDDLWREIWDRQTDHLWEFYWAAARIEYDNYAEAYYDAENILAANKRCRPFDFVEEKGLKDSISGQRQALHPSSKTPEEYWKEFSKQDVARVKETERLDAITAIKRFCDLAVGPGSSFPSTSSVACDYYLLKKINENDDAKKMLVEFGNLLTKTFDKNLISVRPDHSVWKYDGDWLYKSTFAPKQLQKEYSLEISSYDREQIISSLSGIYKMVGTPSPYYAIMILDGDNMGEIIQSQLTEEEPLEKHKQLSKSLFEFSEKAEEIVKQHYGTIVYNGGDDLMALFPVNTCIHAYIDLARKFQECVAARDATASAGIAIAHRKYPLSAALRFARMAEQNAKKVRGKNSVCVNVIKRGGESVQLFGSWLDLIYRFERWVNYFSHDPEKISNRFVSDLIDLSLTFPDSLTDDEEDMYSSLVKDLLERHKNKKCVSPLDSDKETIILVTWASEMQKRAIINTNYQVAQWLAFSQFILRREE